MTITTVEKTNWADWAARLFWSVGGILFVLLGLFQRGLETGGLEVDEFAFSAMLNEHFLFFQGLAWVGLGLACVMALVYGWSHRRTRILAIVLSLCALGTALHIGFFILATVCLMIFDTWRFEDANPRGCESWTQVLLQGSLRELFYSAFIGVVAFFVFWAISSIIVSLLEMFLFTTQYSAFYSPETLWSGSWFLASCAVWFSAQSALEFAVALIVISPVLLFLGRRRWQHGFMAIMLVFGWAVGFVLMRALAQSFEGEIEHIGLQVYLWAFVATVAYLIAAVMSQNIECIVAKFSSDSKREAVMVSLLAVACIPVAPLLHILVRRRSDGSQTPLRILGLLSMVIVACVVTLPLYPDLVDYSEKAEGLFAQIIFGMAFLAVVQVTAIVWERTSAGVVHLVCLTLLILGGAALGTMAELDNIEVRVVTHEYSRLNGFFGRKAYRVLLGEDRLGFDKPEEDTFSFFGKKHATLPPLNLHKEPGTPPHIVIFVSDAARHDRMSAYGYPRPTTPNIDEFAKESVRFDRHYSAGTATTVGLRALFTGSYSTRFMLEMERVRAFFTDDLFDAGYSDFFLNINGTDYNGISEEAFERYLPSDHQGRATYHFLNAGELAGQVDVALKTLKEHKAGADGRGESVAPFLLFMHMTATHTPWKARPDSPTWGTSNEDVYDNTMAHTDKAFGKLLAGLKDFGMYDNAIILFTADHGTGLKDHGFFGGFKPYEEQIRIPLIMKMPGIAAQKVDVPTNSVDVAPTLVHYLRGGISNRFHGVSWMPLLEGTDGDIDREFIFSLVAFGDAYAVIQDGKWKLHYDRRHQYWQLFNVDDDPRERRRLTEEHPERVKLLTGKLASFLWEGRGWYSNPFHYKPWPEYEADRPKGGRP